MKTLYFDVFSGISGDMTLAALVDLGVDFNQLEKELAKLNLEGYHLHTARAKRFQIEGVKFDVHLTTPEKASHTHAAPAVSSRRFELIPSLHQHGHSHPHPHSHDHSHGEGHEHQRNFSQIKELVQKSPLSDWVKQKTLAIFQRIAVAEGKIHGLPPEQVHFHEVGAVDSIIDIVGVCIALEMLGKPRVLASPVIEGNGWVDCAHGRFPVPAPATLAILAARGIAISQCEEPHELVTPTGAAILAELVEQFGPLVDFKPEKIGFGIGGRDNKTRPNVLRAVWGETEAKVAHDWETDTITILETNLDDVSSEILGDFVEKALSSGALDVFYTPILMKKSRPGVLLSVLCTPGEADKFSELILTETSAFGVRRHNAERRKLRREFRTVKTEHGEVVVKLGNLDGNRLQAAPEFESCKKLAAEKQIPIKQVYEAALLALKATEVV